jgi:hypothetical protein
VSRLKLRASSRRLTSDQCDWTQNHLGARFYFVGDAHQGRVTTTNPDASPNNRDDAIPSNGDAIPSDGDAIPNGGASTPE